MNIGITTRYFFTENTGLFFGFNCYSWFNADNSEYIKLFEYVGTKINIDDTSGIKFDLNFGLAITFYDSGRFRIQSDIGFSNTVYGDENMYGYVSYLGYDMRIRINTDKMYSMGFLQVFSVVMKSWIMERKEMGI